MMNSSEQLYRERFPYRPRKPVFSWQRFLPTLTRIAVWGLLFGLLALLSSFFTLLFLTFVFTYLQSSIVDWLLRYIPKRRTSLVVLVSSLFLSIVIALGVFIAPKVYQQAAGFAQGFSVYMQRIDKEILNIAARYPVLQEALPEVLGSASQQEHPMSPIEGEELLPETVGPPAPPKAFKDTPSGVILGMIAGTGNAADGRELARVVLDQLANISRQAITMLTTFLLAFLFSFLIVLDMPHLAASVRDLENTRLRFIYVEVADNIRQFGRVLGQTMQAQFFIACVNTVLTAVGLSVLGMSEQMAFLSVIVFVCSFIPVAGVFISSIPICLIALNTGGAHLVLLSILMIIFIHLVEGYLLNPLIYGARLRINPVIVLIILTVGGKLFHIWGLVLGVPVSTYIFGYAIRYDNNALPPRLRRRHARKRLTQPTYAPVVPVPDSTV